MFDSKNLRNLGTSNFIQGMLAARKASQSAFPTIADHFFSFVVKQSSSCAWVTFPFPLQLAVLLVCLGPNMLPDLTLLNHIFISLLTDLAEEGLPVGQRLEGFGAFFGIIFLKSLFFGGRGYHIHTITLKEEVSEINKQNQLISIHRKDRIHSITDFFFVQ